MIAALIAFLLASPAAGQQAPPGDIPVLPFACLAGEVVEYDSRFALHACS